MNMKNTMIATLAAAAFMLAAPLVRADEARWIRKSSISPDGKTIAFSYQGDIFTVSADGGEARQLTSNPAFDSEPFWTMDGKSIVFASYRELSKDIYVVSATGGAPKRLTTYAGNETPLAVLADGTVLFSSQIQADTNYGQFPGPAQVYSVNVNDPKAPKLVTSLTMSALSANADGTIIFEDYKGYEDPLRKHHVSSVTRDIWLWKQAEGTFTKLSTFVGEDRNPVFAPDGDTFYYLSEEGPLRYIDIQSDGLAGNFNVWKSSLSNPAAKTKLTDLPTHPVRNMSVAAKSGKILFSYNGDLYTMTEGQIPAKVNITVTKDVNEREKIRRRITSGGTSYSVSPSDKEVAFVANGDVYVTSIEFRTTKRITNTPQQERGVCFGTEGREVYYASERDGEWAIWKTELTDKNDKYFTYSVNTKETRVTDKGKTCFQPAVSPDGKYIAYLQDRTDIVVKNLKSGAEKVIFQGINYSYSDGDQHFSWSPDSRSILTKYEGEGGWNNSDVAVIDVESGKLTNLTQSGYSDGSFRWTLKGKAMTWESDKNGYRSHGSWGTEGDIYIMFFDTKAYAEFTRDREADAIEKLLMDEKAAKKEEAKDTAKTKKPEKIDLMLEGREDRIVRLTRTSGNLGDHFLTPDGTKLLYTVQLENGSDLCVLDIKKGDLKVLKKGVSGRFTPSKDGKSIYIGNGSGLSRMDIATGQQTSIAFDGEYEYQPAAERKYIFDHCWKQVSEKFYDPDIHGIDWAGFRDNYAQFLPYIDNNFDFQDLLSEMLGELDGSHTGARYYYRGGLNTGHVGVLFDQAYEGAGLKIAEMLPGGQLGTADPEIKAGDLILAIDGKEVAAGTAWFDALDGKAGHRVLLKVKKGGKTVDLFVMASASDSDLLYKRWVRQREEMVEKLSGGRVGYVHVKGMNSPSFREVFSKALGKYRNCEALIVDTRHNGGGWLHDDLITLLSGKKYVEYVPRGRYIGPEPFTKWTKPNCVLVGEDNYSDASGFPYEYRSVGAGKLIGAPIPGTMTAVWWETQVDNTLVFGIPQVTNVAMDCGKPLENMQINPDIVVYNDPESLLRGEDKQLEAAVKEMLRQIDEN